MKKTVALIVLLLTVATASAKWPASNSTVPGNDGECLINSLGNVGAAACGSGGGAPTTAKYIVQTADGSLSAEQSLGLLTTGLLLNTVTGSTGVLTAHAAQTCTNQFARSETASGVWTCASVGSADLASGLTLAGTTTATITGNVTGNVTGSSGSTTGNAATATALAVDPTACSAGQFVSDIAANGTLTCATPSGGGDVTASGTLTADLPVFGNGTQVVKVGTKSGNTNAVVTTTGTQTSGDCVKIDASGNHIANGSACGGAAVKDSVRAYNSAAISAAASTVTAITLDSERWDANGSHSTSSNTARLTATVTETCQITANVLFAASATGTVRNVRIQLNPTGTPPVGTIIALGSSLPATSGVTPVTATTIYQLTAGDYLEIAAFQDTVGALNVNSTANYSPEFSMVCW